MNWDWLWTLLGCFAMVGVTALACWLERRGMYRRLAAVSIGDDVVTICRHCDGDTSFWCECQGECGRRYCPWTETGMDLAVLADPGAFAEAYADLLAEVEGEL